MNIVATLLRHVRPLAVLAAMAGTTFAETRPIVPFPFPYPLPVTGGLQMSLNTSAYKVTPGGPVFAKSGSTKRIAAGGLVASVVLANRSGSDVQFEFPDSAAAARRFDFRVLNAAGEEVWNSAAEVDGEEVTQSLARRSKWSRTLRVPLTTDGVNFPAGRYTLEAALAGEPRIGATTIFEIVEAPVPPPPPAGTGISGVVLWLPSNHVLLDGGVIAPAVLPSPVRAKIRIQEVVPDGAQTLRAPFVWEGETTADGRFQANTPPGRYQVQATKIDGGITTTAERSLTVTDPTLIIFPPMPPRTTATLSAEVTTGKYTDLTFHLGGGSSYEPPAVDTGIRGKVLAPPQGEQPGVPQAGAVVTVEEIWPEPTLNRPIIIRPAFRWTGSTDMNGNFQVNTPPGRFRVTARYTPPVIIAGEPVATIWPMPVILPLRGSTEVNVVKSQFTETTVQLRPGLVEIGLVSIATVNEAKFRYIPTLVAPTLIQVSATGMVPTGGWGMGTLRYRGTTDEGIVEFDFLGKKPTGIVTQAFAPISATTQIDQPENFRGVRVYSATNNIKAVREN
jgi:hypothetical protein